MRFLSKFSKFYMLIESLQPVKDFFTKIGINYNAVINNPSIGDDDYVETYEEALAYFYQRLKKINKLGYFYLFTRMFNDLKIIYSDHRNKSSNKIDSAVNNIPDIIKFKLSKIFVLFLDISEKDQLNNLRDDNFNKIDINTFVKKQQDGSGWSNKLLASLLAAQDFLHIKKWVNTWPNKNARDMILKDNFYNLDILGSDSKLTVDTIWGPPNRRSENSNSGKNLKKHIYFLKKWVQKYEDPTNKQFSVKLNQKLPTAKNLDDLIQLLRMVEGEYWEENHWINIIRNSKGATPVYYKNNMIIVRVEDVETVKELAYFTTWCIKHESFFKKYNTPPYVQYILYNFNVEYSDIDCCIGFTINETNGRLKFDEFNRNVCQNRIDKPTTLPDIFYVDPTKKDEKEAVVNLELINKEITF